MDLLKFSGADVDIVFSFDTTGGMFRAVKEVSSKIEDTLNRLLKDITIRVGIIAHGDYGDDAIGNACIKTLGFTSDKTSICDFISNTQKTHGDDAAECYEYALRVAQDFNWSQNNNTHKALVIIGDDVPHPPSWTNLNMNWRDEAQKLKQMGIKIYAAQALSNRHAKPFYSALASATNGVYLNFKDFSVVTDMLLAICYREASEDMLSAFIDELEKAGKMDSLRTTFEGFHQQNTPDVTSFTNLMPLVVNTAWWNPKLHDLNKKTVFTFDAHTKQFTKLQDNVSELSKAYANTHLDPDTSGIANDSRDIHDSHDFSYDSGPSGPSTPMDMSNYTNSGHSSPKKLRRDPSPSIRTSNSSSSSSTDSLKLRTLNDSSSSSSSTPASASASTSSIVTRSQRRTPSRKIIDDTDDEGDIDGNIAYFDNSNSSSPISNSTPTDRSPADTPNQGYLGRLAQGRPRRASSFAFGDVPPSTPFSSLFASPSVLSQSSKTASPSRFSFDLSPIDESGTHSDSETTRKRKATWNPPSLRPRNERRTVVKTQETVERPRVGQMIGVRAEGGGFWLAKVVSLNGEEDVDVQWMDEIKSHNNFYVLLDWYDTISIYSIYKSPVNFIDTQEIGVYKLPDAEKQALEATR